MSCGPVSSNRKAGFQFRSTDPLSVTLFVGFRDSELARERFLRVKVSLSQCAPP
jgi:hypothetical protein